MVGKTIRHYKVLEKRGQDGMGEVYLTEERTHRWCAPPFSHLTITAFEPWLKGKLEFSFYLENDLPTNHGH